MTLSGINITNLPADTLLDSGVFYIGSTPFGVTRGAPKFNPNRTWENITFDGKFAPVKGLDRPVNGEPVFSGTMLELGGATTGNQLPKLEPGSTAVTVGPVTTYTPIVAGALLAAGNYITDLRILFQRAGGNYAAVYMPVALCNKYDLAGQNKGEALINVEFVGRIDLATQTVADAAYQIELRTSLP